MKKMKSPLKSSSQFSSFSEICIMKHTMKSTHTHTHIHILNFSQDGGTKSCYRTTLRFETIQWSHAGEWLLLVRSPEGIADASVRLNVTRASGYSRAHVRSVSVTYLLLCLILQAFLQEHRRWSDTPTIQAERNLGETSDDAESTDGRFSQNDEGKRQVSLYIILKILFFDEYFLARFTHWRDAHLSNMLRLMYTFSIANTIEIQWNRSADTRVRRQLLRPWCSSDHVANSLLLFGRF